MLSINQRKLIRSLHQKKYREIHKQFLLEGDKILSDLFSSGILHSGNILFTCATKQWIDSKSDIPFEIHSLIQVCDYDEIKKISSMLTAPEVLSVVRIPEYTFDVKMLKEDFTFVFDAIRDPGNLGTIIRTADWFGIKNIICSIDSVDAFNNKVVQSSMGAVMRTKVHYLHLPELFEQATRLKIPIYGTTMDGEDFFDSQVKNPGIIVFGNESSGISADLSGFFKTKIRIPDFPSGESGSESLNVASSVAVICSELRRRMR